MARKFLPQVATGNHLLEGDVVFLTEAGGWSREHGDAAVARTPEEAEILLAAAGHFPQEVVGVYLADAQIGPDGRPRPVHFREAFRTRGPSNYFHGKQAESQREIARSRTAKRGLADQPRGPGSSPGQPKADNHVFV
ncbi:MAG: DUF2849 domain-containing protein [Paracoccaceae bacterium]